LGVRNSKEVQRSAGLSQFGFLKASRKCGKTLAVFPKKETLSCEAAEVLRLKAWQMLRSTNALKTRLFTLTQFFSLLRKALALEIRDKDDGSAVRRTHNS